jgi:hypothetical protein
MNDKERNLVVAMATKDLPPAEFLRQFRAATDGQKLCREILAEAIESRSAEDVEWSLLVGFTFGFTNEHMPLLIELAFADWHERHEDVVSALGDLNSREAVNALLYSTRHIPDYLDFDESRALAVKAIWALGGIECSEADAALNEVMNDPDPILADAAAKQIKRRKAV